MAGFRPGVTSDDGGGKTPFVFYVVNMIRN